MRPISARSFPLREEEQLWVIKALKQVRTILLLWEYDHAPPGDAQFTPADIALDDIGEALELWGRNAYDP